MSFYCFDSENLKTTYLYYSFAIIDCPNNFCFHCGILKKKTINVYTIYLYIANVAMEQSFQFYVGACLLIKN